MASLKKRIPAKQYFIKIKAPKARQNCVLFYKVSHNPKLLFYPNQLISSCVIDI